MAEHGRENVAARKMSGSPRRRAGPGCCEARLTRIAPAIAAVLLAGIVFCPPVAAETLRFVAQLTADIDDPGKPGAGRGTATLSLDTATKMASWEVEYSGLSGAPQQVGCGLLESPSGPAFVADGSLANQVRGAKMLTDAEMTALEAGKWVCIIGGGDSQPDIGGVLQPAR